MQNQDIEQQNHITTTFPYPSKSNIGALLEHFESNILADLKTLDKIDIENPHTLSYCTIPQASSAFSFADLLGFLLRVSPDKQSKKNLSDTYNNFYYIFVNSGYFNSEYKLYFQILLKTFRHGIAHNYFPKSKEVSKKFDPASPLFVDGVLNVRRLTKDIIEAYTNIKSKICTELNLAEQVLNNWKFIEENGKEDTLINLLSIYPKGICEHLMNLGKFKTIEINFAVNNSLIVY